MQGANMKFIDKEITWQDIEVGKQYRYEEKCWIQLEVTVLQKTINEENPFYISYEMRIDKIYTSTIDNLKVGDIVEYGRIYDGPGLYACQDMQFRPLDAYFSYVTSTYNPLKDGG